MRGLASRAAGSATLSCHSMLSRRARRRSAAAARLLDVGGVLVLVGVDDDHVVGAVGHPGQHVEGAAGDDPGALVGDARPRRRPRLAARWCSASTSMVVRMPSAGMPAEQPQAGDARRRCRPRRPPARRTAAASSRSARPGAVADRACAPSSSPRRRGALDDLALGDELLGVGPAGRLLCAHAANPTAAEHDARPATRHHSKRSGSSGTILTAGRASLDRNRACGVRAVQATRRR